MTTIALPTTAGKQRCGSGPGWRIWLLVFAVAFALRLTGGMYYFARGDGFARLEFPDEQQYWLIASHMASGDGMCDELGHRAGRMPLYPFLLSLAARTGEHGIVVARMGQWIVGGMIAVLTGLLADRVANRRVAVLAAMIVAVDPFGAFFSSLLLTETAFTAAMLGLWIVVSPVVAATSCSPGIRRLVATGALAASCVYLRESSVALVGILCLLLWVRHRFSWRAARRLSVIPLIVLMALLPWALRNRAVLGEVRWLTTRGGISLYDGVRPGATGASDLGEVKAMPPVQALSETDWDAYFRRASSRAIRDEPWRIVRLASVKFCRTWNPIPNAETYRSPIVRAIAASWALPTFTFSVLGVILGGKRLRGGGGWVAVFLLIPPIFLTAVHCLFVGSVRYRVPAHPLLALFAALTVVAIYERATGRKRKFGVAHGEHPKA